MGREHQGCRMKATRMDVGVSFLECKELKILGLGWLIKNPSCSAKAHCKHLWVSPPKGGRNLSLMEQLLGGGYTEKLGCSELQARGVMDLQVSPSPQKKGRGRKEGV